MIDDGFDPERKPVDRGDVRRQLWQAEQLVEREQSALGRRPRHPAGCAIQPRSAIRRPAIRPRAAALLRRGGGSGLQLAHLCAASVPCGDDRPNPAAIFARVYKPMTAKPVPIRRLNIQHCFPRFAPTPFGIPLLYRRNDPAPRKFPTTNLTGSLR
jgi:hypothetical protein